MTDQDLARRAVACFRWRWMPGMLTTGRIRITCVEDEGAYILGIPAGWHQQIQLDHGDAPDLTDPATLGCLLALAREAWGNLRLVAIYCEAANPGQSEGWAVQVADNRLPVAGEDYATEAEALVAALEAAP